MFFPATTFHFGSISLIEEPCRSSHLAAMKVAKIKKQGHCYLSAQISGYNHGIRLRMMGLIMRIWMQSNIIKVSDAEVEFLTSKDYTMEDDIVMNLWHHELKLLWVTLGGKGCKYYTNVLLQLNNNSMIKWIGTRTNSKVVRGFWFLLIFMQDLFL